MTMDDLQEIKGILEAALLDGRRAGRRRAAREAVRAAARRRARAQAARRAARRLVRQDASSWSQVASRLALPGQAVDPALPRPAVARKAAALLARGDGNPGDHRLSATRDPRRHRSHPRRRRVHERRQGAARTANGSKWSATARRRDARRSTRPPRPSSTISACAPLSELPPLAELDASHLLEMPDAPTKAAEAQLALASPILAPSPDGSDAAAEPGAAADHGEPGAAAPQIVH